MIFSAGGDLVRKPSLTITLLDIVTEWWLFLVILELVLTLALLLECLNNFI